MLRFPEKGDERQRNSGRLGKIRALFSIFRADFFSEAGHSHFWIPSGALPTGYLFPWLVSSVWYCPSPPFFPSHESEHQEPSRREEVETGRCVEAVGQESEMSEATSSLTLCRERRHAPIDLAWGLLS